MNKITYFLFLIFIIFSCSKRNEYLKLSGKINNPKDSTLVITGDNIFKEIKIKKDGTFKDTLKIAKKGHYSISLGSQKRGVIYLDKGYDLFLEAESDPFFESFNFKGEGADTNNFILTQFELSRNFGDPSSLYILDKESFNKKLKEIKFSIDSINNIYLEKDVDTSILNNAIRMSNQFVENVSKDYIRRHEIVVKERQLLEKTKMGNPSPKFKDYIDSKGGKKSLESFKGKFVYIDVWATWCGPCIQQIPFLKDLEKQYHNKNIEFVSISTDEYRRSGGSWEAAEKKWRDFVKAKELSGVQLWSGQDYSFQQAYQINSIPRFILIDPKGNIVDANAPRPSDPRLKDLFTSLGI